MWNPETDSVSDIIPMIYEQEEDNIQEFLNNLKSASEYAPLAEKARGVVCEFCIVDSEANAFCGSFECLMEHYYRELDLAVFICRFEGVIQ